MEFLAGIVLGALVGSGAAALALAVVVNVLEVCLDLEAG